MEEEIVKTRFAPSPNGRLRVANVRTALFNWLMAHQARGVFLLRIEDTDASRSFEEAVSALQGQGVGPLPSVAHAWSIKISRPALK